MTFSLDGSGSLVELDRNGTLERFAPGSTVKLTLDSNVGFFTIDGSGAVVELNCARGHLTRPARVCGSSGRGGRGI